MNIALIADPYIAIPPYNYGGIERVIDMLIKGYLKRGHRITLWAHPDSKVDCELMPYGIVPHRGCAIRMRELWQVASALYKRRKKYDIVHCYGRMATMIPLCFSKIPKIQSYQRAVTRRNVWLVNKLAGGTIFFTANSHSCHKYGTLPGRWKTIYNGILLDKYTFNNHVSQDAPLVFLGRIEKIKGLHTAIDVVLATGKRLVIAGNVIKQGDAYNYFRKEIEPKIDGKQIIYIGEVNDEQKNKLLKNTLALLMPVDWEEPFGIVMIESLACGTPVIGFKRGAIPEVIQNGINGFICDGKEEMKTAIRRINEIDRKKCRQIAEKRFSDKVIVEEYMKLYKELINTR